MLPVAVALVTMLEYGRLSLSVTLKMVAALEVALAMANMLSPATNLLVNVQVGEAVAVNTHEFVCTTSGLNSSTVSLKKAALLPDLVTSTHTGLVFFWGEV
jgi:hypothetical protein